MDDVIVYAPMIYSFPRSGSHYLAQLLKANLFMGLDTAVEKGEAGHHKNRVEMPANEYGKLIGGHHPPDSETNFACAVHLSRDVRGVVASLYRSKHFRRCGDISFSDFIREPLDWKWSPGLPEENDKNVIEHWVEHTMAWMGVRAHRVRYEVLCAEPGPVVRNLATAFGIRCPETIVGPADYVGIYPSRAGPDGFKELWSEEDEAFAIEIIKNESALIRRRLDPKVVEGLGYEI